MQKGKKQNCWEFNRCGREPGGTRAENLGVCPAATESGLDGVHGGKNGGRTCWVVAGTQCDGTPQGSFVRKHVSCTACDFYKMVRQEEGSGFLLTTLLLKKMKFNR